MKLVKVKAAEEAMEVGGGGLGLKEQKWVGNMKTKMVERVLHKPHNQLMR